VRSINQSRGQHHHDIVDAIVRDERRHAALEHRAAADIEQLLRHSRAKPAALPGGCNDGGYMHGNDRGTAINRRLYRTRPDFGAQRGRFVDVATDDASHLFGKLARTFDG
jgi:hypothetical protein